MSYTHNASTWEVEEGETESEGNLDHIVRSYLNVNQLFIQEIKNKSQTCILRIHCMSWYVNVASVKVFLKRQGFLFSVFGNLTSQSLPCPPMSAPSPYPLFPSPYPPKRKERIKSIVCCPYSYWSMVKFLVSKGSSNQRFWP